MVDLQGVAYHLWPLLSTGPDNPKTHTIWVTCTHTDTYGWLRPWFVFIVFRTQNSSVVPVFAVNLTHEKPLFILAVLNTKAENFYTNIILFNKLQSKVLHYQSSYFSPHTKQNWSFELKSALAKASFSTLWSELTLTCWAVLSWAALEKWLNYCRCFRL